MPPLSRSDEEPPPPNRTSSQTLSISNMLTLPFPFPRGSESNHVPYSTPYIARNPEPNLYVSDTTYDKTIVGKTSASYPESSQRTIIDDRPYISGYSIGNDHRFTGLKKAYPGTSEIQENVNFNQTASIQRTSVIRQPSITARPDMYHRPADALRVPLLNRPEQYSEQAHSESDTSLELGREPVLSGIARGLQLSQNIHPPNQFNAAFVSPSSGDTNNQVHLDSNSHAPRSPLSIPMCNDSGEWSRTTRRQNPILFVPGKAKKRISHITPDPASSTSVGPSGPDVGHSALDIPSHLASSSTSKKKKAKMHQCEVCGKQFPRPSGLQTHMNTHNNVKPFPCGFPGCERMFTVRSNATRHLRTHGITLASPPDPSPAPYVVDFSTPTVIPSVPTHQITNAPFKIRWMPPSLTTRTNASTLSSLSDGESDSEDSVENDINLDWRLALPIPFHPVVPFSHIHDCDTFEERNSYLDAKPYPYHPSQFCILPGPAIQSRVAVCD